MVTWAAKFLKQPPRQPLFLAAGMHRPHLPWYAPRKCFDIMQTGRYWQVLHAYLANTSISAALVGLPQRDAPMLSPKTKGKKGKRD
jgi:hypothetical protein